MGNEIADELAQRGAAANLDDVRLHYDSAKATILRATRRRKITNERIRRVYGMKGKNHDRREESKLLLKEQTTMGRL